jgi:hypothetical protein
VQSKDKFIAFVDILGFSSPLKTEEECGRGVSRALELIQLLGSPDRTHFPSVCPHSARLAADVDFKVTQISDCVVVSAEPSPVGVVNLTHYCFGIGIRLLGEGALCRGYIARGNIYHADHQFIGTGYVRAVENEKRVRFMCADMADTGTPFIQIDEAVSDYVKNESDSCVRKMFARMTRSDGTYTAIYPFEALSKIPGSIIGFGFDPVFWKQQLRKSMDFREHDLAVFDESERLDTDEGARRKIRHYKRGLEEVIARLRARQAALDQMIATGVIPYGGNW